MTDNTAPIMELLDRAAGYSITTNLSQDEINQLLNHSLNLHKHWKSNTVTKLLILALKIEQAKLADDAAKIASNPISSDTQIRILLNQQTTVNKIITYVQDTLGAAESIS